MVWWVVALLLLGLILYWGQGEERRALMAMNPAERAELFQRDFATFESMCLGTPESGLLADCRARARFLRLFPECDAACRGKVSRYGPGTR
ncbi:hypothetical protein [Melittangium boletus]|uniref:Uncharacterized protein n=1 Tax=Melittangium boletus DSM 14713 TaxID=1294270 RepID=A0A250IGS5_9BACT|nr:hypothetical protein [Melittangium boletus]ATB30136.1 hypothetical protein MEBOL_003591 [Melittangium boletus DSM 14713]